MKKGKLFLLILLLAAGVAAGLYGYPRWKAARLLQEKADFACFSYELEAVLDWAELPEKQQKMVETIAELAGVSAESLCRPVLRGSVWQDKIHVLLYPHGESAPVAELYLGYDISVINETMSYHAIRENLVSRYGLLENLMPKQEETVYISLEQAEQLFEADLSAVRGFGNPLFGKKMTAGKYFAMLLFMAREENGKESCFQRQEKHVGLCVEVSGERAKLQLSVKNPEELAEERSRLLSALGMRLPKLQMLSEIKITVSFGESGSFAVPDKLADQNIVDILTQIRDWVRKIF